MPPHCKRILSACFAIAGALFLGSCGRGVPSPSSSTPVILISIDTLRSDHLPVYGYKNVSTPNIDAFRNDSILYERAYSHVPLTLPSHATMLTGLLPGDNGVRDNVGFPLRSSVATLPELMKKNGYATGAAISAFVLRADTGISRGFDTYDDHIDIDPDSRTLGKMQRSGDETEKIAEGWISSHENQPFFYFLHLYEPHSPYEPPEPLRTQYQGHEYDGEIAHVDQILGRFLDKLKADGLYDRSMIIFLSDHGEGLMDHGEREHGTFLYRESLQVPLIVKLPKEALRGRSVSTPVQLIDLLPTIATQTKTPFDAARYSGASLLSFLRSTPADAQRRVYSETYYPRFHFGWSDLHSLISGNDHYIQAPKPELYDLATDPGEKKNTLLDNRRAYTSLRAAIAPMIKEAAAPEKIDPEEAAKLAALGYVGSTVATSGENLEDPKDHIEVAGQMGEGFRALFEDRADEAIVIFQTILRDNPKMLDVWDGLARAYASTGRYEEAINAAKEGLKISPQTQHLAMIVAQTDLKIERYDEAEAYAGLAMSSQPAEAHEVLARVWLARGNLDRAEQEASAAVEKNPNVGLLTLATIKIQRGDFASAFDLLDRAEKSANGKPVPKLHFTRGDALARMERTAEAEKEFGQEIRFFPKDPQAYQNLLLLYATEGRLQDATAVIYRLIQVSPAPSSYLAVVKTLRVIGDERGAIYWARQGAARYPSNPVFKKLGGL